MKNKINAHENILSLIGKTPLIKLNKVTTNCDGNYYAKYEALSPGHSNKDRIAIHIIESAEKKRIDQQKYNYHRDDVWKHWI